MNDKPPMAAEFASRDEASANEVLQKWLSTLAVGNGAALFGALTIGFKDGQLYHPPVTLTAGWLFLFGVIAASYASVCLGASHRNNESYWRLSHAQDNWKSIDEVEKASALDADIRKHDKDGDTYAKCATISSIAASILFILGVGVPLGFLTLKAVLP